jgi:hypothetical protein
MKIISPIILFSVSSMFTSGTLFGAVSFFDFEGSSVPSNFSLTGQGGAFSQSITSTNAHAGSNALSLNLTTTGAHHWAQSTINMPERIEHISFSIYDEFAGNSPVYYYVFLGSLANFSDGLLYLDQGYEGIVHAYRVTWTNYPARSVGWHVMDISIGNTSIDYRMNGSFIGSVGIDPSTVFDTILFQIANAGFNGSHSLLIDNLSISTVPEPSSSLLGLISLCAVVVRRSRSHSSNNIA